MTPCNCADRPRSAKPWTVLKTNHTLEALRKGDSTLGCFLGLGSPQVTEVMSATGLDWLVIETEHSAVDIPQAEEMLRAMKGTDTVPLIRLPSSDPVWIQRALDIGAQGIVVPLVKSAEEAQAIVRATRYPPVGTRGFGPLRASNYTLDYEDYFRRANDNILIALIVETKEIVEDLERTAAVPGIDVLIMGSRDLSLSLGLDVLKEPHPEVEEVLNKMLEVGRKTGVAAGIHAYGPQELQAFRNRGFRFLSYKTDYMMLLHEAQAGLAAFRSEQPSG